MGGILVILVLAFVMFSLVSVFGWIFINFFPIIILIVIINMIRNKNNPNRSRTYYYRTGSQQDFEDFFRTYSSQGRGYSNGGGYSSGNTYSSNPFEDKSKYYKILGLESGASKEEIKKAFREKAKQHHPDKFANEAQNVRDYHEAKFKEINEAYNKLN